MSEKKNMKIIGTYVNDEIYNILQKEADKDFTSISSVLRKIIYKYLNSKKELN